MAKQISRISDIEVHVVDGVDLPANRKRFKLFKSMGKEEGMDSRRRMLGKQEAPAVSPTGPAAQGAPAGGGYPWEACLKDIGATYNAVDAPRVCSLMLAKYGGDSVTILLPDGTDPKEAAQKAIDEAGDLLEERPLLSKDEGGKKVESTVTQQVKRVLAGALGWSSKAQAAAQAVDAVEGGAPIGPAPAGIPPSPDSQELQKSMSTLNKTLQAFMMMLTKPGKVAEAPAGEAGQEGLVLGEIPGEKGVEDDLQAFADEIAQGFQAFDARLTAIEKSKGVSRGVRLGLVEQSKAGSDDYYSSMFGTNLRRSKVAKHWAKAAEE
jgi:hypothetical protein